MAVLTIQRNRDYISDIAIWDDTVAKCPQNPRAHHNLGIALTRIGRLQEAIGQYEQALRIKPDYVEAHYNLGIALARIGRIQEAIGTVRAGAADQARLRQGAQQSRGSPCRKLGRIQEAIAHYEQALRIKPDYAEAHNNLGIALAQTGKIEDAIGQYEQALRIKPDYAEAHYNLGNALAASGQGCRKPSATTSRRCGSSPITPRRTTTWGSLWRKRAG